MPRPSKDDLRCGDQSLLQATAALHWDGQYGPDGRIALGPDTLDASDRHRETVHGHPKNDNRNHQHEHQLSQKDLQLRHSFFHRLT